ncbi:outer membrane protein assembly factor BamD [Leptobacterium flavescens]|uniref:Outer membrane protein assembly factor BamD n=1 Tax=Leptobacterium flavescens TaxID=472055 RepID=A0A6P0UJ21_9FLAO|nr:outer membrane protein assembly factor BamD [Leptobacterium flavescens]NER13305.1 outer membrane protein assembly factor BamD [Leptobacterium flavescens]
MIKNKNLLYLSLVLVMLLSSCGEYQSALKSEDVKVKYELAEKYYNEGDYKRAVRLFEQIVPKYVGKPQGERIIFLYADAYYKREDYYLAAYQFDRFSKSYPRSEKAEEASFYGAKSYYELSPKFSIDQTETVNAIEKLQLYINKYPDSERIAEANEMVRELRIKLEKKAYERAKQYYTTSYYHAAIKALELFISDNPGTPYKEDALFYQFSASYALAINSIQQKKEERLADAKKLYESFSSDFGESKHMKEASDMMKTIDKELEQFSK